MGKIKHGGDRSEKVVGVCDAWTGPVWPLGGESCGCISPAGHVERDHVCSCGTRWDEVG